MATNEAICQGVEETIAVLADLFTRESTRFFTEADILCHFRRLLENILIRLGVATILDADGHPHSLVHSEFPTPFRCDMGDKRFSVKTDEDRTPRHGKFQRGHYDVVVLSPGFVKQHTFARLKSQDFKEFQTQVLPTLTKEAAAILYGVELAYRRDEIKPSPGVDKGRAARAFVAEVLQDANKLEASRSLVAGFMQHSVTLAFLKGTTPAVLEEVHALLADRPDVRLIVAE